MGRSDEELMCKRDELMSRDVQQVAEIQKYGIDLSKHRKIDLTFWAPSEPKAKELSAALERNGMPPHMVLGPGSSEANQRWLVRCSLSGSIQFITTKENLVTFLLIADKYDCEYDGWGTAIIEAAN